MEKQLSLIVQSPLSSLHTIEHWKIHIDGAARGNPGPAGAGVLIEQEHRAPIKEGIYLGEKTNNQAEYIALAYAIFLVQKKIDSSSDQVQHYLEIYSDSELLVRQMNGLYKIKNETLALIKRNIEASLQGMHYKFIHVVRENNKEADKLANIAIDKKNKIPTDFLKFLANCGFKS